MNNIKQSLVVARVSTINGISEVLLKMAEDKSPDQFLVCLLNDLLNRSDLMENLSEDDQKFLRAYHKISCNKFTD